MKTTGINATISPKGSLDIISKLEATQLQKSSQSNIYETFRRCSLAVLNSGSTEDDVTKVLKQFEDFEISIIQKEQGVDLEVKNAPDNAFVDGEIITGIQEHLFAVLRDILYVNHQIKKNVNTNLNTSEGITDAIFHILRNAQVFHPLETPNLIVCWGGHSISREEYEYTKEIGYRLGLRRLNVCTGCGPGAMKGPMKGTAIGHAKQRKKNGHYIGLTEPGIIAAESPNPIVNSLVIMPDIEKRLEAFVRLGHGIIVFPGGAGTTEEILYLLGILLHPKNASMPFPVIFTGPKSQAEYFQQVHEFIGDTLGFEAQQRYKIIIDNPIQVAREMKRGVEEVQSFRETKDDAFYFNWSLHIEPEFQIPFDPTHENMSKLKINFDQPIHSLAANLRKAFSGIVAGNIKEDGIRYIEKDGPYKIKGDKKIMEHLDTLLQKFVKQGRMKIGTESYKPCYKIIS